MELAQQMLAVVAVLALLGAALWWLRRKGRAQWGARRGGSWTRRLQAAERLALGPQHSLYLIRLADRGLLIALSPSGANLLESVPWSALEEAGRPTDRSAPAKRAPEPER